MESKKSKRLSKPIANVLTRIVICAIALSIGVMGMMKLASLKKPPAETKAKERPLKVEALKVSPERVQVVITGYGEVKPLNVVPIAPEVSGKIVEIHPRLETGEIIPKGEILFKVDSQNYHAVYRETQGVVQQWENTILRLKKQYAIDAERLKTIKRNRTLAKEEFERIRKLFEKDNVGTRSGVDKAEQAFNSASDLTDQIAQAVALYPIRIKEAQSSLSSAEARSAIAGINLKRCKVIVPFDSRIKSVSLEKDQYVSPGQNLITLADDSVLEIHVPLDSRDVRKWLCFNRERINGKTGWFSDLKQVKCKIRWTESPEGNTLNGHIHRVVKFDKQTRTITVAVRIDPKTATQKNPEALPLVEGMFCSVLIPGRILDKVIRLPRWAVSFENTVFVATADNRLKTVPVRVARAEGNVVYVADGLKSGDTVITTRLIDPLENTLLKITNKSNEENMS